MSPTQPRHLRVVDDPTPTYVERYAYQLKERDYLSRYIHADQTGVYHGEPDDTTFKRQSVDLYKALYKDSLNITLSMDVADDMAHRFNIDYDSHIWHMLQECYGHGFASGALLMVTIYEEILAGGAHHPDFIYELITAFGSSTSTTR